MDNTSTWTAANCVVVGSSGGIGSALVRQLLQRGDVETVHCMSRSTSVNPNDYRIKTHGFDFDAPQTIVSASRDIKQSGEVDLVVVATGELSDGDKVVPEKSLRDISPHSLARSYAVNAIGPMLIAQSFLPLMRRDRKSVFAAISARVGSISDNRLGGWYGYRAAKSGLNQLLKTASIEHARRWKQGVVVGLHPGTVNTALSKPFQSNVPTGKLFEADYSASCLLQVIDGLDASSTGKVFAFDGREVPA